LGISSNGLEKKALGLGWRAAAALPRFSVSSRAELGKAIGFAGACIVSGKSSESLRKACALSSSPMLVNAFEVPNYHRDDGLVRVVAQAAQARLVAFELPLSLFLRLSFVYRARFVSQATSFVRKCVKLKAPIVVTSGAADEFELKSPREAIALAGLFGLSQLQARAAISNVPDKFLPSHWAEKNGGRAKAREAG
jgi:RNase P/RNase MRP subunit p30